MEHKAAVQSVVFRHIKSRKQKALIRLNNGKYNVGDTIILYQKREGEEEIDQPLTLVISHILHCKSFRWALRDGWDILSVKIIEQL